MIAQGDAQLAAVLAQILAVVAQIQTTILRPQALLTDRPAFGLALLAARILNRYALGGLGLPTLAAPGLTLLDAARLIALDRPPRHCPLLHRLPFNSIRGFCDPLVALRTLNADAAWLALRLRHADSLLALRTFGADTLRLRHADALLALRTLGADALRTFGPGALLDHSRAFGPNTLGRLLALHALLALRALGAGRRFGRGSLAALRLRVALTAVTALSLRRRGDRQSGDGGDQ